MEKEESDNIFDHASRMLGSGKKKEKPKSSPTAAEAKPAAAAKPDEAEPSPREVAVPAEAIGDEELDRRVNRAQKMFDSLQSKVEKVYDMLGVSPGEAEEALSNPAIPDELRKELDLTAKTLEEDLFRGRFTQVRRRFSAAKQKKKAKRRRGKGVAGRKRWLSM